MAPRKQISFSISPLSASIPDTPGPQSAPIELNWDPQSTKKARLPKPAVDILTDWLRRHSDRPNPSKDEKERLSQATGLSVLQIHRWLMYVSRFQSLYLRVHLSSSL